MAQTQTNQRAIALESRMHISACVLYVWSKENLNTIILKIYWRISLLRKNVQTRHSFLIAMNRS